MNKIEVLITTKQSHCSHILKSQSWLWSYSLSSSSTYLSGSDISTAGYLFDIRSCNAFIRLFQTFDVFVCVSGFFSGGYWCLVLSLKCRLSALQCYLHRFQLHMYHSNHRTVRYFWNSRSWKSQQRCLWERLSYVDSLSRSRVGRLSAVTSLSI